MDAFLSHFVKYISQVGRPAYFITANADSLVQSTRICCPEGFYYFFTKFLRSFVSGTDGVNCPATRFPAIFKNQARHELLCFAVLSLHIPEDCIIKLLGVIKLIRGLITERYSD